MAAACFRARRLAGEPSGQGNGRPRVLGRLPVGRRREPPEARRCRFGTAAFAAVLVTCDCPRQSRPRASSSKALMLEGVCVVNLAAVDVDQLGRGPSGARAAPAASRVLPGRRVRARRRRRDGRPPRNPWATNRQPELTARDGERTRLAAACTTCTVPAEAPGRTGGRARIADRGARVAEDDEALRPDGGHRRSRDPDRRRV